jgi:hypothetical protein
LQNQALSMSAVALLKLGRGDEASSNTPDFVLSRFVDVAGIETILPVSQNETQSPTGPIDKGPSQSGREVAGLV